MPLDGPYGCGRKHSDPCPKRHRSLCYAPPGGFCPTRSVGDQTSEGRGDVVLAQKPCDRVGCDPVSNRSLAILTDIVVVEDFVLPVHATLFCTQLAPPAYPD